MHACTRTILYNRLHQQKINVGLAAGKVIQSLTLLVINSPPIFTKQKFLVYLEIHEEISSVEQLVPSEKPIPNAELFMTCAKPKANDTNYINFFV